MPLKNVCGKRFNSLMANAWAWYLVKDQRGRIVEKYQGRLILIEWQTFTGFLRYRVLRSSTPLSSSGGALGLCSLLMTMQVGCSPGTMGGVQLIASASIVSYLTHYKSLAHLPTILCKPPRECIWFANTCHSLHSSRKEFFSKIMYKPLLNPPWGTVSPVTVTRFLLLHPECV